MALKNLSVKVLASLNEDGYGHSFKKIFRLKVFCIKAFVQMPIGMQLTDTDEIVMS